VIWICGGMDAAALLNQFRFLFRLTFQLYCDVFAPLKSIAKAMRGAKMCLE
jgi:hypothetical protein